MHQHRRHHQRWKTPDCRQFERKNNMRIDGNPPADASSLCGCLFPFTLSLSISISFLINCSLILTYLRAFRVCVCVCFSLVLFFLQTCDKIFSFVLFCTWPNNLSPVFLALYNISVVRSSGATDRWKTTTSKCKGTLQKNNHAGFQLRTINYSR